MSFIQEIIERGYFYQCTNLEQLTKLMESQKIAAYVGFDCTARSLHIGNLMQIMILRLLQQNGHKPIIIIGGGTSKIGDPTGRDEVRKMLTQDEIQHNIEGIKKSLSKFINFGEKENDALILNNDNWLNEIKYIDFLSNYGKLFSINRMLTMESVKRRLESQDSLSFLEFNYMILQGYDFYHLYKNYNCYLQFGGSDQWGNIVTGTDLIRRQTGSEAFGITTPLLATSSGIKMGKTLGGAVWLNEDLLSPYDYYQYWRNCEDLDVIRFAKLYSEFSNDELIKFEKLFNDDINSAKKHLAYRLTLLCHGLEATDKAHETSINIFEKGAIDDNLPTVYLDKASFSQGICAFELFFEAGLAESKTESRKLIRGGGAKINDIKIEDENLLIHLKSVTKISSGKKKHILIKIK